GDPGRGVGRGPPPGRLPPLARRRPTRARPRPVARSLHLPAREQPARELRGLAVRPALLAARRSLRAGRRLEHPAPADLPRGGRIYLPVAAGARPSAGRGARRRTRLRARAVPGRAERWTPTWDGLGTPAPRSLGVRALASREPVVARGCRRGRRVDPVLRPAPRARGGAVLPVLRRLPRARPLDGGGSARRGRGCRRGGPARQPARHLGLDRLWRALLARGLVLLRGRARLRQPAPSPRARELRLPGLAHALARARGAGARRPLPEARARA